MSITKRDILRHIRSSWSYISKKKYDPKPRPGVYGKNLNDSIKRLAERLDAPVSIVRKHVVQLICEGVVMFVKERLVIAKDKNEIDRKVATPNLALIISQPSIEETTDGLPPEKSYLRSAWSEYFGAGPSPSVA